MLWSRKRSHEAPLYVPLSVTQNNKNEVIETINHLGLSREKLIAVGSGALTLLGLDRRANDLDLLAHPELLASLRETGALPNGTIANMPASSSYSGRAHFRADTSPLPIELFGHLTSLGRTGFESDEFESLLTNSTVDVEGIHVMDPDMLLAAKKRMFRIGDEKSVKDAQDTYDRILLSKYLERKKYTQL